MTTENRDKDGIEGAEGFIMCPKCPSLAGCAAASFCVIESRFQSPDQRITAPTCGSCQRSAASAWACTDESSSCDARSDLWGQWFIVQMYANDARKRLGQIR